ncbi:hypothetical protein [Bacillus mycoides]|uniref:hypothetical protein n=1 Tax=Bacillus mycoides TaxID=1405 RepID=UPI00087216A6|nr:hypothetical protein [Bacillus mycoides]OFD61467.1 hypothetical protein BWGOE7_37990 [Bacillus mycoides]OFD91905.1 hypothetical protein BWGOE12_38360 [Bacillus mycoides]
MTAEICIMNKLGVAMAADSAVTLGNTNKTYNSANKLFALSKTEPVGIMIYGTATFMGIPWETLIKIYRNENPLKRFDTLEEYGIDLIKFLKKQRHYITKEDEISYYLSSIQEVFDEILSTIREELMAETKDKSQLEDKQMEDLIKSVVANYLESYREVEFLDNVTEEDFHYLNDLLNDSLSHRAIDLLGDLCTSDDGFKDMLVEIGLFHITKYFTDLKTGVVLSGFGTKEIFPALCAYTIDGFIDTKLKYNRDILNRIGIDTDASIAPFAQLDMVYSFIEGIDPNVQKVLNYQLFDIHEELIMTLDSKLQSIPAITATEREAILEEIMQKNQDSIQACIDTLDEYKNKEHIDPILSIVKSLPKDELAEMAGALINLSSLKRRVSSEQETVGGPIDVAIITKGDGLIWIKRKHYFNPKFNSDFFIKNPNGSSNYIGKGVDSYEEMD